LQETVLDWKIFGAEWRYRFREIFVSPSPPVVVGVSMATPVWRLPDPEELEQMMTMIVEMDFLLYATSKHDHETFQERMGHFAFAV
jgi:hypothetical protein